MADDDGDDDRAPNLVSGVTRLQTRLATHSTPLLCTVQVQNAYSKSSGAPSHCALYHWCCLVSRAEQSSGAGGDGDAFGTQSARR